MRKWLAMLGAFILAMTGIFSLFWVGVTWYAGHMPKREVVVNKQPQWLKVMCSEKAYKQERSCK